MIPLEKTLFEFKSNALPPDTFAVVDFEGQEGLSECYQFQINLVSKNASLDLGQVLHHLATFTIRSDDQDIRFHGIVVHVDQLHQYNEYTFYRAVLAPRFYLLHLTRHNQVFIDQTIPEILTTLLKDANLTSLDYQLRLENQNRYQPWELFCQYKETHFHFFHYWTECEGMYYFFEQQEDREKLVITDSRHVHQPGPGSQSLKYVSITGLDQAGTEDGIHDFTCRQQLLPQSVKIRDYDYLKPTLDLTAEAQVSPEGLGLYYEFGEHSHFQTQDEGNRLANIRAESLLCREKIFTGQSGYAELRPGYTFDLSDHYRQDFNQKYLTVKVRHSGSQAGYLVDGIQPGLSYRDQQPFYRNEFSAIPANVQFRPERLTSPPKIWGTFSAVIDAAGSGQYAELDEHGRYKVILPFDLSTRKGLKASAWLRMAQPYSGSDHGMHFPLHKGTEVLLSFIAGDPNRPIIIGTTPNADNPSVTTSSNATTAGIKTAGGSQLSFQDQKGAERIAMHSGDGQSSLIIGSGSESGMVAKTNFKTAYSSYISSELVGGAMSLLFNGYTFSVGPLVEKMVLDAISNAVENYKKIDQLGKTEEFIRDQKSEKGDKETLYDKTALSAGQMAAVYSAQIVPPLMYNLVQYAVATKSFTSWMEDALKNEFKVQGESTKDEEKKWYKYLYEFMKKVPKEVENEFKKLEELLALEDEVFFSTVKDGIAGLLGDAANFARNTYQEYGISLFNNCPSPTGVKSFVDPRNLAKINIGTAPNILVGASQGKVDILAQKGVNILTGDDLVGYGQEVWLRGKHSITLNGDGAGTVLVDPYKKKKIRLEYDNSSLDVDKQNIKVEAAKKFSVKVIGHDGYISEHLLSKSDKNEVEVTDKKITLQIKNAKIEIEENKIAVDVGETKATLQPSKAEVSVGGNKITVSGTAINAQCEGGGIKVNSLGVSVTGNLKVSGTVTSENIKGT